MPQVRVLCEVATRLDELANEGDIFAGLDGDIIWTCLYPIF